MMCSFESLEASAVFSCISTVRASASKQTSVCIARFKEARANLVSGNRRTDFRLGLETREGGCADDE